MPMNAIYHGPVDLPAVVPIFPLPGALLLPRGQMPLNIFEPRYLAMIDDALASGDADAMRDALVELKRLQEPYLNWAGKAEGTSFAVDTVSLHVHERVDPATILANARKRLKGEKAGEAWRQADLFAAAFENLPLRQALDFYHHEKG